MTDPLVSCVIPVFNGERYLAQAIASVLGQGHRALEILVVDDGSTDKTTAVVESFGSKVRYLRQDNAGPVAARNHGIREAQGDFTAFLDADDVWHPDKLSRQLACFRERPELAYCVSLVQNFWDDDLHAERDRMMHHPRGAPVPGYVTSTLLAPRRWLDITGGFDGSLMHGDSAEWFTRVQAMGGIGELVRSVLVFRRIHGGSLSRRRAAESRDEFLHLLKRRLDHQRGHP